MKTNYVFIFLLSFFLCIACDKNKENDSENEGDNHGILICENSEVTGDYDLIALDENDSTILLAKFNSTNGFVTKIDIINSSDLISLSFNENGLPESYISCNESLVMTFDNYKDNTFDMALKYGEEVYIQQGIPLEVNSITRSSDESYIEQIKTFYYNNKKKVDGIKYAAKVVSDLVGSGWDACTGKLGIATTKFIRAHIRVLDPVFSSDLINETADLTVFTTTTLHLLNVIGTGGGPTVKAFAATAAASYPIGEAIGERVAAIQIGITEWVDNLKGMLSSGIGSLKVTLSWDFYADIDLHALEPNGTTIWWQNPTSSTGGFLDVDNREGGPGAIENIYWETPEEGAYHFYLNYYDGIQSGTCTATVTYKGEGKAYNVPMTEGSWVNFASRLISNNTRANGTIEKKTIIMDVIVRPEGECKSKEPIVRFREI